jgi:hypothetical protein
MHLERWPSAARLVLQTGAMGKVRKTKEGLKLKRWFKEKWRTLSGDKDYSGGDRSFRPTVRVSKDTPATASELTDYEKRKGKEEKKRTGRVVRWKRND